MNLTYFKVYKDFINIARELDNGQRGRVFLAILQYVNGEETEPLTGGEKIAFMMMKGQIDRDSASYDKTSEVRSEAGRKGAMARWGKDGIANATDAILPITNNGKNAKTMTKDKEENTKTKKNIPPISPQGDRFDDFWKAYPKKDGQRGGKESLQ